MKKRQYKPMLLLFLFFTLCCFTNCQADKKDEQTDKKEHERAQKAYERVLKRGKLIVLMQNSTTSYFVYRGAKMGYEYELIAEFAKSMGLKVEIVPIKDLDRLIPMLKNKKADIIACNFAISGQRKKEINFSIPYMKTKQVLIQRKENTPPTISVKTVDQLKNKKIYIWQNSSYYKRLIHLQEEIGDSFAICAVDGKISDEELIEQVAQKEIDYTVTGENIALINSQFYPNIDFSVPLSLQQNIAFGLHKEHIFLQEKLNAWLDSFLQTPKHRFIYQKYYKHGVVGMSPSTKYSSVGKGHLSPYDLFFQQAAEKYQLDWQLCAAVAYQESKFNPDARGFGGAYGIMQFMPNTGSKYGVYPDSSPQVQISGGTKKIKHDLSAWKHISDPQQRIKFALASYNAGHGHVEDAQRLAVKYKLNPKKWDDNVEKMMLKLSQQKYFKDRVVKYGQTKGQITCNYVQEVFARYNEWKELFH